MISASKASASARTAARRRALQNLSPPLHVEHFDLGADQIDVRGEHLESIEFGAHDGLLRLVAIDKAFVERGG